jgi:ribosomal protein S18 acetylase RimI-like enzyme
MNTLLGVTKIESLKEHHYDYIVQQLDTWWDGRNMVAMLPRLWFKDFQTTSFIALNEDDTPIGFLVGYISATDTTKAYVHFIGIDPACRGVGVGSQLYETFFNLAKSSGATFVDAVTSPKNLKSLLFHESMGFKGINPTGQITSPTEAQFHTDYDGPGEDRIVLRKNILE